MKEVLFVSLHLEPVIVSTHIFPTHNTSKLKYLAFIIKDWKDSE